MTRKKAASARGLFRATGKKAKAQAVLLDDGSIEKSDDVAREKNDFYPTRDPRCIRALFAAERDRLRDFPVIWEPACGDGTMVHQIKEQGFKVYSSDLVYRNFSAHRLMSYYDFLAPPSPAVVTNGPFNECNWRDGRGRWIEHSIDVLKLEYLALLMSWSWPGAHGLGALWQRIPPARVYLMQWKIDFTGGGAPPMLNGWFVWDRQWQGETALRMLSKHMNANQGELFLGDNYSQVRLGQ